MTTVSSLIPTQIQMACWQIALRRHRKPTSGGPRDYTAHLAYQRSYARRTYGVRTAEGVAHYLSRAKAYRVRAVLRAAGVSTLHAADMAAAGCSATAIVREVNFGAESEFVQVQGAFDFMRQAS